MNANEIRSQKVSLVSEHESIEQALGTISNGPKALMLVNTMLERLAQIDEGKANFLVFNEAEVFQKVFRTDIMQEDYFVISNFNELLNCMQTKVETQV